jgi:membrane fusion protein (multidrug efflux system)
LAASWREEVRTAEANFERIERLVEQNLATGELLDQAGARFESARAQLLKAEETARDYTITAPWDGVVSRLIVKEGQFVAPRAAVVEMFDPTSLVIRVSIPERYATMVNVQMHVDIDLDAYPARPQTGYVSRVYPQLNLPIRSRPVEVSLTGSPELLPGMFARLRIPLQTVEDAIVLPAEAIVTTADGQTVAFVVEGGKAIQRRVVTGLLEGNRVEVVEGIDEGDQVIIAGTEKIKAGSAVRIAQGQDSSASRAAGSQPEPAAMPEGTRP